MGSFHRETADVNYCNDKKSKRRSDLVSSLPSSILTAWASGMIRLGSHNYPWKDTPPGPGGKARVPPPGTQPPNHIAPSRRRSMSPSESRRFSDLEHFHDPSGPFRR